MLVPNTGEFIFNPGSCCQLENGNANVLYMGTALGPSRTTA